MTSAGLPVLTPFRHSAAMAFRSGRRALPLGGEGLGLEAELGVHQLPDRARRADHQQNGAATLQRNDAAPGVFSAVCRF